MTSHVFEHADQLELFKQAHADGIEKAFWDSVGITPSSVERFMTKVLCGLVIDDCWLWTGAISGTGYGSFNRGRINDVVRYGTAHEFVYELFNGPVTEEDIDHTCHNNDRSCPGGKCIHRRCVNPHHLVDSSHLQNIHGGQSPQMRIQRTGACARGHAFNQQNTYRWPKTGERRCKVCSNLRRRAKRAGLPVLSVRP